MTRMYPALLLLPLVACLSTTDGEECVSVRRGISEASGTATVRFIAKPACDGSPACEWDGCAPVAGGLEGEVECHFPVGGVGQRDGAPPAGGCDVVGWDDRRDPSDSLPTYVALRCADPGPYLFFGLPDLRTLDADWPLSKPVLVDAEPALAADSAATLNPWGDPWILACANAGTGSTLDGLVELAGKTGGAGAGEAVDPDFRVSVRVDGHIPLRDGVYGDVACTDVVGLDFRINLIQTAADYSYCE